jgi:hypothetical protein
MEYNPYDLIPIRVNGHEFQGRPTEFDSEVADNQAMTNAFGNTVKATKISTSCPDCGQGLAFDITLGEPPFAVQDFICYNCNPAPPPTADPFMNPLDEGRVAGHELDPLLHDPSEQVVPDDDADKDESSVADRIDFSLDDEETPDVGDPPAEDELSKLAEGDVDLNPGPADAPEVEEEPEKASEEETPSEAKVTPEATEKPKKKPRKPRKKKTKVAVEPAEGMTPEVDLDDDLAEDE